jgi:hypothetical protein
MSDKILSNFLRAQDEEGRALAAESPILELYPDGGEPTNSWEAVFHCTSLVRLPDGQISETGEVRIGIRFDRDYLRRVDPSVVTVLGPPLFFHPNALGPALCVGNLAPGMSLVDVLNHLYDIITFRNWASHDGLDPDACRWARQNQERFPTDPRPLKGSLPEVDASLPPLSELIKVTEG